METPLAERVRPRHLEDYIGQEHLVGLSGVISQHIQKGHVPSIIFWGPPGVGKTTLAELIATTLDCPFFMLSAISAGVKDVRAVIETAKKRKSLFSEKRPILFIDEIHRFSKSQQDSLLGAIEKGWITLLGATTENPSFEVISALLSRCQVYVLNPLSKDHLERLLNRAIEKDSILSKKKIHLKETQNLIHLSGGDGRKLLNILEIFVNTSPEKEPVVITNALISKSVQKHIAIYDKSGEQHYDIISAFIKSIRGSDPNAAVYWLARMIEGGEDVKFIARRLLILASEDIGNANPTALVLANSTFQAVNIIGFPESRIILSQCAIYLATSPKSNASYTAIEKAINTVKKTKDLSVPLHLRNAPTKLMKDLNYGADYKYSHDYQDNFILQEFMPEEIKNLKLYNPSENAKEKSIKEFLKNKWQGKYDY